LQSQRIDSWSLSLRDVRENKANDSYENFSRITLMRALTGAILILAGEQGFSHAFLIGFPHQIFVQKILIPFAGLAVLLGLAFLVFGCLRDHKPT